MKTLVICATAQEAQLLKRTFFADNENTHCIGAGVAIVGYHFHRIIYMPGWDRINEQAHEWRRLAVNSRKADVHFHMDLYL